MAREGSKARNTPGKLIKIEHYGPPTHGASDIPGDVDDARDTKE